MQDALDPLISPQPAYGHYATELHGTLLSAIPPEAAQNPSYDDIAIEQRTERLVTGLMGLMDPDDQERDVRKVIWSGGRMRAGGVKAYGGDGECSWHPIATVGLQGGILKGTGQRKHKTLRMKLQGIRQQSIRPQRCSFRD